MRIAFAKIQDTAKNVILTAVQYPVNIGYLAAVCLEADHQVEMWDFCVEPFTSEYINHKINEFDPEIIGISCVTPAIYYGNQLATIAKQGKRDVFVIIGGVHVSALPLETLKEFPNFDIGIMMEAEETILEILSELEKKNYPLGIKGTVYRENDEVKLAPVRSEMPDVNSIPFPNRDLVPQGLYKNKHSVRGISRKFWNVLEVDSSRGCPYSCTFCGVDVTHGRGVRFRTPENVLKEIEVCREKYDTNFIVFNDSTFTLKKERVAELVSALPGMGIEGYHVNAHVNSIDNEMLNLLEKTGCKKLAFGIESGSDKTLRNIQKSFTREKAMTVFKCARKSRIPTVEAYFILGADIYETENDFKQTESLIKIIRPDILGLGIITPYPGTEQYDEMKKIGFLDNVKYDQLQIFSDSPPTWRIVNFTADELVQKRNSILKSYIWSPWYVLNRIIKIRSLWELIYYVKMAKSFFNIVVKKRNFN